MTTSILLRLIASRVRWLLPLVAADLDKCADDVTRMELSLDEICRDAQDQAAIDGARDSAIREAGNVVRMPRRVVEQRAVG